MYMTIYLSISDVHFYLSIYLFQMYMSIYLSISAVHINLSILDVHVYLSILYVHVYLSTYFRCTCLSIYLLFQMYMSYVKNCKFSLPSTLPLINFMRRSLVEVYGKFSEDFLSCLVLSCLVLSCLVNIYIIYVYIYTGGGGHGTTPHLEPSGSRITIALFNSDK